MSTPILNTTTFITVSLLRSGSPLPLATFTRNSAWTLPWLTKTSHIKRPLSGGGGGVGGLQDAYAWRVLSTGGGFRFALDLLNFQFSPGFFVHRFDLWHDILDVHLDAHATHNDSIDFLFSYSFYPFVYPWVSQTFHKPSSHFPYSFQFRWSGTIDVLHFHNVLRVLLCKQELALLPFLQQFTHRRTSRGTRGAAAPPVTEVFEISRAKRWWFGLKYSGESSLKGCQSQTWRLLSPMFALSRRS